MISTTLVFLTVQHLSQTTKDIHVPSHVVKSVIDITKSMEISAIKPLNSNILTLNTLAPKFTLVATEPTNRLPDMSQKALDSKTIDIQTLKKVATWSAIIQAQQAKSLSHSSQLPLDANNAETELVKLLPHTLKAVLNSNTAYIKALKSVSSSSQHVLLALVDHAYATMAVNFFLTSIKPYSIENYMILTMNSETCKFIETYGVKNCFQYRNFSSTHVSKFGSKEFNDKMNVRTDMILEALEANITVLHSDTDVIFFQNPFRTVPKLCPISKCDIIALKDVAEYNAGFLLVHPTQSSKKVYRKMKSMVEQNTTLDDQTQFNIVLREERKK